MTKANNDAHSIKSYYVLAKSLTGFDLLDGDEEKQNKYLYIPESLINAERRKENIKEGFLIAEALREIAKWYFNNVFTYQSDKSYDDFIVADKINGVSGHNIYMLGTGVDKRIELLKDSSANTPIFGGNYSNIGQKQGSDIEIRRKENDTTKTYYFKRMTDNILEFNYDSLCYIKASKEACENNHEYIKRSGSKLNYYIGCDKVSGFEYNDVGDDCTRFAFAVLELGTGEEAKNLGDLGDDAGQFIEGTTIGGTIEKMSAYFDIYTGNSFIEEYNKGLKDGDMLVSKIGDGESATKKNSRNHCEFIYNNTLNPIGVFGWGNVKKTTNSRARFSIKKNNTTNAEYVYNSEDGTYYSALYRRKTQ